MADNQNQNQNQAQQDAQRRADEQRRAAQQQQGGQQQGQQQGQQKAGQPQGGQQDSFQRGVQQGQEVARQRYEEEKRLVGERPQQVGNPDQQPTPTQQENDEIGAGLRHVDDKKDDGSGPDPRFAMRRIDDGDQGRNQRRVEADQTRGKYETRGL